MPRGPLSLAFVVLLAAFVGEAVLAPSEAQAQSRRGIPINIESVPPGATVYLDSVTEAPLGVAPLRNVRVPTGQHTLIFRLASHEEARLSVTVRRRRETFRAVLRALGTIEVVASNAGAEGATVEVDGRQIGGPLTRTPVRVTDLQPGRHQIRARREGYVLFEQWVEVAGGQLVRVPILMEQAAPDTGSILVGGPPGSAVYLDGQPRGSTPTVLDDVAVGPHALEIRPASGPPYSTQVTVLAGQRATVTPPAAVGGTLRVLASVPEAVIRIDGEVVGPSPAVRQGVVPGEHIVEATAEGYERIVQTVTVTEGQQRVVSLEMSRRAGQAGRVVVQSNVAGAMVIVDAEERGAAPVVFTPPAGTHAVVVRADGYREFSTTCETSPGQDCEVEALLQPEQVRIRVAVQPGVVGAELVIDEQVVGPVPFDGVVDAGQVVLEVRAPDYIPYRQQILLEPSSDIQNFDVTLSVVPDASAAERVEREELMERRRSSAATHAAAPLPVNQASLDISIGWPYLAEVRLNVGLLEFLDAGFTLRTFGRLTDFEGRVRAGFRPIEQLSVGGQVRFGGGIGPTLEHYTPIYTMDGGCSDPVTPVALDGATRRTQGPCNPNSATPPVTTDEAGQPVDSGLDFPINSLFVSLEAMGSLHFSEQAAFTLWFGMDFSSDEYGGHGLNAGAYSDTFANGMDDCTVEGTGANAVLSCPREDLFRARLGGSLELVLTRNWNVWALIEGVLNAAPRRIYGNLIGITTNDTQFYFRLGTTYKF